MTPTEITTPDGWEVNADTDTHLSLVQTTGDHVLILTPSTPISDKWRVKGLQGFDTEADYPVFAVDVSKDDAEETAVGIMESISTGGEGEGIETVSEGADTAAVSFDNPDSGDEDGQQGDKDEVQTGEDDSDGDGQADLSSFL